MNIASLAATMAPIALVVALGVLAGLSGAMRPSDADKLSSLALKFCLPALLFDATVRMDVRGFANWRLFLVIALGLSLTFIAALVAARWMGRDRIDAATMQAAVSGAPDLAAIGLPILLAVLGKAAVLPLVVGNIVMSFVLLPLALLLLAMGRRDDGDGSHLNDGMDTNVLRHAIGEALINPLVWAPFAGICLALLHIPLPATLHKALTLIGDPLTGILLFAMGLFLVGRRFRVGGRVIGNVVSKLIGQPAVMAVLALIFGLSGAERRAALLLGALPSATVLALFAVQYDVYTEETEATILISAALSIVTIGIVVGLIGGPAIDAK